MNSLLKPFRSLISVTATIALVLTGLLGSVAPAQATDNKALVANETVATAELVRGKTLVVTGFAPNSTSLTAAMQKRIERFIENNPDFDFVRCLGFADRSGTPATNNRLGVERATAGCDVAVEANPDVEVSRQAGKWNREFTGADIRRVSITLSNYATKNITTTFNGSGATPAITTKRAAAGTPKVLPSPALPGLIFAGWFTAPTGGTKVGDAGQNFTPKKSQTLWAQWTAPSSGASGGTQSSSSQLTFNFRLGIDTLGIVEMNRTLLNRANIVNGEIAQARTDYCGGEGVFTLSVVRADDSGNPVGDAVVLATEDVPTCDATNIGGNQPQPGATPVPLLTDNIVDNGIVAENSSRDGVLALTREVPFSSYIVIVDFGTRIPFPTFFGNETADFGEETITVGGIEVGTGRWLSEPLSGSDETLSLRFRNGGGA